MLKINLEEIIKLYSLNDTITTRQSFIYFGKQLLELAAENADTTYVCACGSTEFNPVSDGWSCKICGKDPLPEIEVDKQSILDTIKQVE